PRHRKVGQGGGRRHAERDVVVVLLRGRVRGRRGVDLVDGAAADHRHVPGEIDLDADLEEVGEVEPGGGEAVGQGLAAVVLQDEVEAGQPVAADERDDLGNVKVGHGLDVQVVAVGEVDRGVEGERAVQPAGADIQLVVVLPPVQRQRARARGQVVEEAHVGVQHQLVLGDGEPAVHRDDLFRAPGRGQRAGDDQVGGV